MSWVSYKEYFPRDLFLWSDFSGKVLFQENFLFFKWTVSETLSNGREIDDDAKDLSPKDDIDFIKKRNGHAIIEDCVGATIQQFGEDEKKR